LANRREPVIDLRYHAFQPVTPDSDLLPSDAGRTSTADTLWRDLFAQLRDRIRGRYAELQMPVEPSMLNTDQLRAHVLRIANVLGKERRVPWVVAIDGIDHAARLQDPIGNFLKSLVPPDQVPEHLVFLISGQLPDGYPEYPPWLRAPNGSVHEFEVGRLSLEDVQLLVRTRLPTLDTADQAIVAKQVRDLCDGHTLATVFAIEEAARAAAPLNIAKVLESKGLSTRVDAYYENLWAAVSAKCSLTKVEAITLAACAALSPARLSGELLFAAVPGTSRPVEDWKNVLRDLAPLIVE
jgi:hypothetical protein